MLHGAFGFIRLFRQIMLSKDVELDVNLRLFLTTSFFNGWVGKEQTPLAKVVDTRLHRSFKLSANSHVPQIDLVLRVHGLGRMQVVGFFPV